MNTPRVIGYGTVPFLPVTAADGLDFSDIHLIASFLSYPEVGGPLLVIIVVNKTQ
jgi:hypothetical protein